MYKVLKIKQVLATVTGLLVIIFVLSVITDNSQNTAGAEVEISATPSLITAPIIVPPNAAVKLTINEAAGAPHIGALVRIWDEFGTPNNIGSSCAGVEPFGANGQVWELRADTDGDGDFTDTGTAGAATVSYTIPDTFTNNASISMEFGDGGNVIIALNGGATVSPTGAGVVYSWTLIDTDIGSLPPAASQDGTDKISDSGLPAPFDKYDFVTCGIEGPGGVGTYLQSVGFFAELPQTLVTKTPDKNVINPGGSVTYTYKESNVGNITLRNVVITDKGEDLNNNGIKDVGEDSNNNGLLDPGCSPLVRQADNPGDNDSLLELGEAWVFTCTKTLTSVGINTNMAFVTADVCSDDVASSPNVIDCNLVLGQHTGNPVCQAGSPYPICDPNERVQATVTVVQQPTKIIIKKDTIPNDPQDFTFTHNIPPTLNPFILDDDSNSLRSNMKTFDNPPPSTYKVTETIVKEIPLRSIRCEDPDGGSFRSGNSAIIDLDAGETVTCTFTNGIQVPLCGDGIIAENQPEDAISMTSIRNGSILKTIHAEKQIFNCELDQGEIPVIADVTIIAEIYENIDTKTILSKQAVAITCIKDPDRVRMLECDMSTPSTDRIPVTNCIQSNIQHPQEMNSMQKGNTAKTIETQKEVFQCTMNTPEDPTDDKKVDLLLFTELFQNLNLQETQAPQIMSMKCVIKIDTVTVEACRFTNHPT